MRPFFALISAVLLAFGVLVTACSPRESSSTTSGSTGSAATGAMPPASAASR